VRSTAFGSIGTTSSARASVSTTTVAAREQTSTSQEPSQGAGQENLTVLLRTSPIFPGFVEAATLLAGTGEGRGRHDPAEAGAA
jgi:hypothetical protein